MVEIRLVVCSIVIGSYDRGMSVRKSMVTITVTYYRGVSMFLTAALHRGAQVTGGIK